MGSSLYLNENYTRKCFWTQEKETRVNFNHGLNAPDVYMNIILYNDVNATCAVINLLYCIKNPADVLWQFSYKHLSIT